MRAEGGFLAGDVHWIDPAVGTVLGALAMGEGDITDVAADVSGERARVFCDDGRDAGCDEAPGATPCAGRALWCVEDLGSKNGTVLVSGATGERQALKRGEMAPSFPETSCTWVPVPST